MMYDKVVELFIASMLLIRVSIISACYMLLLLQCLVRALCESDVNCERADEFEIDTVLVSSNIGVHIV